MPNSFITPNEYEVRGGVEFGFMSTTTNREVAIQYARGDGGLIFQIQARAPLLQWHAFASLHVLLPTCRAQ